MNHKAITVLPFTACLLPLLLVVLSVLDAFFTLICIQRGGSELNPFMRLALGYGPETFFTAKMLLTIIPAIVLASLSRFRAANYGLYVVNIIYIGILFIHLKNLFPA
jgi:hypothetical protein